MIELDGLGVEGFQISLIVSIQFFSGCEMAENSEFKILILPGNVNQTPHSEDIVLLITEEEFLRMWRRGQIMIRNRELKGKGIDGGLTARSSELS